jgi:hypothetical protein
MWSFCFIEVLDGAIKKNALKNITPNEKGR